MRLGFGLFTLFAAARTLAQPPACCTATIRVTVPEGTATVYLAGSLPEFGPWRPDGRAMTGAGRERRFAGARLRLHLDP
jgi:hypothetical protein